MKRIQTLGLNLEIFMCDSFSTCLSLSNMAKKNMARKLTWLEISLSSLQKTNQVHQPSFTQRSDQIRLPSYSRNVIGYRPLYLHFLYPSGNNKSLLPTICYNCMKKITFIFLSEVSIEILRLIYYYKNENILNTMQMI